jgi:hypothetical protein
MLMRALTLLVLGTVMIASRAQAQSVTQPFWVPGANPAADAPARARFQQALGSRGLGQPDDLTAADALVGNDGTTAAAPSGRAAEHGTPLELALDREAATRARAKGATFALIGRLQSEPRSDMQIDLRLVDAQTGLLRESTAAVVPGGADTADLVAAVLRLDEIAGRSDLTRRAGLAPDGTPPGTFPVVPPPARSRRDEGPSFATDTRGWLRARWPLLTALTTAVGTSIVLAILVAKDGTSTHP